MALTSLALVMGGCGDGADPSGSGGTGGTGGSGGTTSSGGTGGGAEIQYCEKQHVETFDGSSVVFCDTTFPEAPFVHVPEQKTLASGHVEAHLALDLEGFTDGAAVHAFAGASGDLEAESMRQAFAIYRTELDETGKVVTYEPAVFIDERNFLRALEGRTMQGTISVQTGDEYALDPTLPIHVTFGAAELADAGMPGMTRYRIPVVVDNLTGGIEGDDGSCLPSMESHGAENPFTTFSSDLIFSRVPSMHGLFDNVSTIAYNDSNSVMAAALYFAPSDLIGSKDLALPPYEGAGHGTPGSMPNLFLHVVTSGGAACTP